MKRRHFSLSATAALGSALGGNLALPLQAQAQPQGKAPQEGNEYLLLAKPAPTEAPAGKVEVVEFFWYGCPHCYEFEPQLQNWVDKQMPKNVAFRRVPVAFRPEFEAQQRLFYALETLGKLKDLHPKVFATIHAQRLPLATNDQIIAWAEKQGLNKAKFVETYSSFSVVSKARKATQLQDSYGVSGVPSLGVAGRWYTDSTQARTMPKALQVVEYLVTQASKK